MPDAEALFLIDNQQAKVGKLHILRKQAMRAYQDVNFSSFHSLQNFLLLLRRAKAADHFDGDGKRRETLFESFEMLEGEHGCGRENCHLLVVVDGLESRPHGYFGFSIAHVTAKQPVHRRRRFHEFGRSLVHRLLGGHGAAFVVEDDCLLHAAKKSTHETKRHISL